MNNRMPKILTSPTKNAREVVINVVPVNSNTTGTITPMFSSYDWMKPNLKQKAGTARGKWLVRKDWGKLRGVKSLFLSENIHEK